MQELLLFILLLLPVLILVPKIISPLKDVRCLYGFHKYFISSVKAGHNMSAKRTKGGKAELVFRDVNFLKCCRCSKYKVVTGGVTTSNRIIKKR